MAKGIVGVIVPLVIIVIVGAILYKVFKSTGFAELIKSPEEKAREAKEEKRADRGLAANIFAGIFGEDFARKLDEALGGTTYSEDTPDSVDKGDSDKVTKSGEEKAKREQDFKDAQERRRLEQLGLDPVKKLFVPLELKPKPATFDPTRAGKGAEAQKEQIRLFQALSPQEKHRVSILQKKVIAAQEARAKIAKQTKTNATPNKTQTLSKVKKEMFVMVKR